MLPLELVGAIVRLTTNQMIFNEGDAADHFYKVVEGRVRLCKVRYDGRRQIVDFLVPDDLFGFEIGSEHTLIAEAIDEVVLERYSFRNVEQLSEKKPDIRHRLTAILYQTLHAMQNHMVMLGQETARERTASFLVTFAPRMSKSEIDVLDLGMGRQDIADYVGLALETVCRELSALQREGCIEIMDRRRIAIRDMAALQSIADGRD